MVTSFSLATTVAGVIRLRGSRRFPCSPLCRRYHHEHVVDKAGDETHRPQGEPIEIHRLPLMRKSAGGVRRRPPCVLAGGWPLARGVPEAGRVL